MAKRKTGVRYKCGKLKQEQWKPYRQEFITENKVHDGRTYHTTIIDNGSTALTRLHYRKLITEIQRYAGEEYERLWQRYRALCLGAPRPVAKVGQLERGLGFEQDIRVDEGAEREFMRAWKKIRYREMGQQMTLAINDLCLYDNDPKEAALFLVRGGLSVLAGHFKLWKVG